MKLTTKTILFGLLIAALGLSSCGKEPIEVIKDNQPVVVPEESLEPGNLSMGSLNMNIDTAHLTTVPGVATPIDFHFLSLVSHSTNSVFINEDFFAIKFNPIALESSLILGKHTSDSILMFDFSSLAAFDAWVLAGSVGNPPTIIFGQYDGSNISVDVQGIRQAVSSRTETCIDPINPLVTITKTIVTDHIDIYISGFITDPITMVNVPVIATIVALRERVL